MICPPVVDNKKGSHYGSLSNKEKNENKNVVDRPRVI
jgi:hypothetical protein